MHVERIGLEPITSTLPVQHGYDYYCLFYKVLRHI